jgi:hypothetical protein
VRPSLLRHRRIAGVLLLLFTKRGLGVISFLSEGRLFDNNALVPSWQTISLVPKRKGVIGTNPTDEPIPSQLPFIKPPPARTERQMTR